LLKGDKKNTFGNKADTADLGHATQRLQSSRDFLNLGRRGSQDIVDGLLQTLQPVGGVFDFMHVVEKGRLPG
jgi:hypothetical protein